VIKHFKTSFANFLKRCLDFYTFVILFVKQKQEIMKVLKIILGVLVGIIVLFAVWNAMLPSTYRVERSTTIYSESELIADQIATLKNWDNWSPWRDRDPNAEYSYGGIESGKGAGMSWKGNDSVGVGTLNISEVSENQISYTLAFKEPWESSSAGGFVFEAIGDSTKVTWFDSGDLPFLFRWMGSGMDEMIGADFEMGLYKLKTYVESIPRKPQFQVEVSAAASIPYYGMVDSCTVDAISQTIGTLYGKLMESMTKNKVQPAGYPFVVYETWDGKSTRMRACLPVADNKVKMGKDIIADKSYEGPVLKLVYYGAYEGTGDAHNAIDAYATENGIEIIGAPWEVYVTDPSNEPDTSKWVTEIYYPIK
jgi:effector-binding domain-containing protein